jgi:hypothetical protein
VLAYLSLPASIGKANRRTVHHLRTVNFKTVHFEARIDGVAVATCEMLSIETATVRLCGQRGIRRERYLRNSQIHAKNSRGMSLA